MKPSTGLEAQAVLPDPSPPCLLPSGWTRPVATSTTKDLALGCPALGSRRLPLLPWSLLYCCPQGKVVLPTDDIRRNYWSDVPVKGVFAAEH